MAKLEHFHRRERLSAAKLNTLVDAINGMGDLRGDGYVNANRGTTGWGLSINRYALGQALAKGPVLKWAKVVEVFNTSDETWAGTDLWQSHVEANPATQKDGEVDTGATLHLVLTPDAATASAGYLYVAADDYVSYIPNYDYNLVPSSSADYVNGYVVHCPTAEIISGVFPVQVTENGVGAAGDATTKCTYQYTVTLVDGTTTIGLAKTPLKNRPATGQLDNPTADDYGLAFIETGTLYLYDANETLISAICT